MKDERLGKRGSAKVAWPNGRRTMTAGTVIWIAEASNEVYLETALGNVVADLYTLEMDEITTGDAGERAK